MPINLRNWIYNHGIKSLIAALWLAGNTWLFIYAFEYYRSDKKFYYTFRLFGYSLPVSRGSAQVIYLNVALVLLPVCRALATTLRRTTQKYLIGSARRLVDDRITFHMMCGYMIFIASVAHILGHIVNCFNCYKNYNTIVIGVNIASSKNEISLGLLLKSTPVWSGILMLIILITMLITSHPIMRKKHFELFWYSHHLSFIFCILLFVHGFGRLIKYQSNMKDIPSDCLEIGNSTDCLKRMTFKPVPPVAWKWLVGPFLIYIIDRLVRYGRGSDVTQLTKVIHHHGNVMELVMKKAGFSSKPGQYVLVQFPSISDFQWHPFTLTKCPTKNNPDDTLSIHIKLSGDWTKKLSNELGCKDDNWIMCSNNAISSFQKQQPNCFTIDMRHTNEINNNNNMDETITDVQKRYRIRIDGPYGAPSQDITRFNIGVCIGAGIGLTPSAAILNYLRSSEYKQRKHKLTHLYFIGVARDFDQSSWFIKLLQETQAELSSSGDSSILDVRFHVTQSKQLPETEMLFKDDCHWLSKHVRYGRPNWMESLNRIEEKHHRVRIGVFYCGPQTLSAVIKKCCERTSQNKNILIYHSEGFG